MGEYNVEMDDEGIIRCSISGLLDRRDADGITKDIIKLSSGESNLRVLMDLKDIEGTSSIARRIYIDTIKSKPEVFRRVALLGKSTLSKVTANFIITGVNRVVEIRYFVDLKEALLWLKE